MGDYWEGYFDDDPIDQDELDEDEMNEWGCLFGDRCLMPGEHLKKECHTAEMLKGFENGSYGTSLERSHPPALPNRNRKQNP